MVSGTATKLGALGKWIIARKVALLFGRPNSVGSNPARFKLFRVLIRKYFFTDCTAMLSSTDAKLMGLMKPIITQNSVVKLSYPTGVGSNPARPQCF